MGSLPRAGQTAGQTRPAEPVDDRLNLFESAEAELTVIGFILWISN
jgi:hypothetical protein